MCPQASVAGCFSAWPARARSTPVFVALHPRNHVRAHPARLAFAPVDTGQAQRLRDLQVSANSITNNGGRFDQHRGESPASLAYRAALGADLKAQGQQGEADVAAMKENAGLQRTGMHEQGENQRSLVQAALEQQKIDQTGQAQGYANRQASLVQRLRDQIVAEPDQTKRSGLVQQLREVSGQSQPAEWGVQVTPTTKNVDGSTSMGSIVRYNKATGQTEVVQQSGGGNGSLPPKDSLVKGQTYQTPRGPARWDGAMFQPV